MRAQLVSSFNTRSYLFALALTALIASGCCPEDHRAVRQISFLEQTTRDTQSASTRDAATDLVNIAKASNSPTTCLCDVVEQMLQLVEEYEVGPRFSPKGPRFPLPAEVRTYTRDHCEIAMMILRAKLRAWPDGYKAANAFDFLVALLDAPSPSIREEAARLIRTGAKNDDYLFSRLFLERTVVEMDRTSDKTAINESH